MNETDSLARRPKPEPGLVEVRAGGAGLPALFGETFAAVDGPVVGDDDRLRVLQAQLRAHRNPLIAAAAPLLDLILVLAEGARHESPRALRMRAAGEIREFHRRLEQQSVSLHSMRVASYALCGALDEAVLTTDWGSESGWSMETLLWTFHQDSSGGESFFRYLANLTLSHDAQIDLVELLVLLIDLGFQGYHRISNDGAHTLETIRLRLHAVVRAQRPEAPPPLCTPRPATGTGRSPWRSALGAAGVCMVLVLAAGYVTLYLRTQALADPLMAGIEQLLDEYPVPGRSGTGPSDRHDVRIPAAD